MKKSQKIFITLIIGISIAVLGYFLQKKSIFIVFDAPTKIMSEVIPDDFKMANPNEEKTSSVLKVAEIGSTAVIIDEFYTKDLKVFKIKTSDNIIGYIFIDDKFHVQENLK